MVRFSRSRCLLLFRFVEPLAVQLGPAVLEEEAVRRRQGDALPVEFAEQRFLGPRTGPGDDPALGIADEGLSGELESLLLAHAITEGGEVSVLKGGHPHLRLEEPFRPLSHLAGLGHHHHLGAGQRQGAHVFGVMPVVADCHTHLAAGGLEDRGAQIAEGVIAALVEAVVVRNVDHAGLSQQRAVGVDDR